MAWTLRGSTVMPCWEMINPRRHPTVMQKHALEGIQADVVLTTPLEDDS
jgi:hypothetical protein